MRFGPCLAATAVAVLACGGGPGRSRVAFSRDGRRVLLDGYVAIDASGARTPVMRGTAWSPDGARAAWMDDGALVVDNVRFPLSPAFSRTFAWVDDGTILVAEGGLGIPPDACFLLALPAGTTAPVPCPPARSEVDWMLIGGDRAVVSSVDVDGHHVEVLRYPAWTPIVQLDPGDIDLQAVFRSDGTLELLTACHLEAGTCASPAGWRRYRVDTTLTLLDDGLPPGAMPSPVDARFAWVPRYDDVCVGTLDGAPDCFPGPPPEVTP